MFSILRRSMVIGGIGLSSLLGSGLASAATYNVIETQDINDGNCVPNNYLSCSLREALAASDATPEDDTIYLYWGDYTINSSLTINSNVTVTGLLGPLQAKVRPNPGVSARIFNITSGEVYFNGITITGAETGFPGAGVNIEKGAELRINDVHITHNKQTDTNGGGGGVFNQGYFSAANSIISHNSAISTRFFRIPSGGGIRNWGELHLLNTEVSYNVSHIGGGISNKYGGNWDDLVGVMNIDQSSITGNQALAAGGGIFSGGGYNYVRNTNIENNTLSTAGFNSGAIGTLSSMKFEGGAGFYAGGGELDSLNTLVNSLDPSQASMETRCEGCHIGQNGFPPPFPFDYDDYTLEGLAHKIHYTMAPEFAVQDISTQPCRDECAAKAALFLFDSNNQNAWIGPYRDFWVDGGVISGNMDNVDGSTPSNCKTVGKILWDTAATNWPTVGMEECVIQ